LFLSSCFFKRKSPATTAGLNQLTRKEVIKVYKTKGLKG
jgi:hypothetical protein